MNISSYHLGLIGYPLAHSLSPRLHHAALRALGLNGEYQLYPTPPFPEGSSRLCELLANLRTGKLHGLNVTIPHKQNVIPLLDILTPPASAIGAVNTIFCQDGNLMGDNTDAPGFMADLRQFIAGNPSSALVLGAGGSARAVVYALAQSGCRVYLAARRLDQAQGLAQDMSKAGDRLKSEIVALRLKAEVMEQVTSTCDLIVNTTPVGMHPNTGASPWPMELPFPQGAAVYDLVYNPSETMLVRLARQSGLLATTGLGMLIEQAALAFERWTGQPVPREVMRKAVT